MTTEQIIILAFLAAAFVAGWAMRALVGGRDRAGVGEAPAADLAARAAAPAGERIAGALHESAGEPERAMNESRGEPERAMNESRGELERAIRAYHSAVVRSLRGGSSSHPDEPALAALAGALVALSGAVEHESRELDARHPLTGKLERTGLELRRLADEVIGHSRERELPSGVFDRLEQSLISAASTIFASDRLRPA